MSTADADAAAKAEDGPHAAGPSRTVARAAVAILVAFAGLVAFMLISASASDEQVWQRQMYVFASVEAIVFTAAGALFGVEVKRQETAKAVQVADRAIEEAEEAKKSERQSSAESERGRTLAATARGLAATASGTETRGPAPDVPGSRGPSSTSQQDALRALAHVANELFPPGK